MSTAGGFLVAVSRSTQKGRPKVNLAVARLIESWGMEGDVHAGSGHRQISLLATESIDKMRAQGLAVGPGAFAENLTTSGLDLPSLPVGTRLAVGEAELEITQLGKECHHRCAIYEQAGDCVMPREGVFAQVVKGGTVKPGDRVFILGPAIDAKP
jgi:molybdopterin adenylyltransferase